MFRLSLELESQAQLGVQRFDRKLRRSGNTVKCGVTWTLTKCLRCIKGIGVLGFLIAIAEIGAIEKVEEFCVQPDSRPLVDGDALRRSNVHLDERLTTKCIGLEHSATRSRNGRC